MRKFALALAGVVLAACSSTPQAHWRGTGERVVQVRLNPTVLDPLVVHAVLDAAADWSAVAGLNFTVDWGTCPVGPHCVDIIQEHGTLAYASLGWDDSHHMYADAGHVAFVYADWDYGWLLFVACHEMGHVVGLGHSPHGLEGPCDYDTANPTAFDLQIANDMYAHDD